MLGDHPIAAMIPALDLARARAFYADTLGLKILRDQAEGVEFESGGVSFAIYPTRTSGACEATIAGWMVEDLDGEMADLRQRGVTFEEYDLGGGVSTVDGVAELDGERGAWFKDSEGNVLAVSQLAR